MGRNKPGPIFSIVILVMFIITPLISINNSAQNGHTRQLLGRSEISNGLPTKESYSSIHVYDVDGDGLDEMYLGGAGRGGVRTEGIHAFEYDSAAAKWNEFGTGLSQDGLKKYYGGLSFGDINYDGHVDIIAPLHTKWYYGDYEGIELYLGDGTGSFSLEYTINTGESTTQAHAVDLDNDGYLDISVATNSGIRTWFGSGSITEWTEKSPPKAGNEITGMDAGDLNNDELIDLVGCPYFGSNAVRMYVQTSKRIWKEIDFKKVNTEGFGVNIIDFNDDGRSDVLYGTRNEGIKAWLGNGGGSIGGTDFTWTDGSAGLHDSGGHWQQLELQDLTGDGKPELIAGNNGADEVFLYINDHPNGWSWIFKGDTKSEDLLIKEDGLIINGQPYGANFGDWDGDGEWDVAACAWGKGIKAWLIEGEGSTNGDYPGGGDTPPELEGYDEQGGLWTKIKSLIKIYWYLGIFGLVVLAILILYLRNRRIKKKKTEQARDDNLN